MLLCWSLLDAADPESESVRGGSSLGLTLGLRGCWEFRERGFLCRHTGLSRRPSELSFQDLEGPRPRYSGARFWLPDLSPTQKGGAPGRASREYGCKGHRHSPPLGASSASLSGGERARGGARDTQRPMSPGYTSTTPPEASTLKCPSGQSTGRLFP